MAYGFQNFAGGDDSGRSFGAPAAGYRPYTPISAFTPPPGVTNLSPPTFSVGGGSAFRSPDIASPRPIGGGSYSAAPAGRYSGGGFAPISGLSTSGLTPATPAARGLGPVRTLGEAGGGYNFNVGTPAGRGAEDRYNWGTQWQGNPLFAPEVGLAGLYELAKGAGMFPQGSGPFGMDATTSPASLGNVYNVFAGATGLPPWIPDTSNVGGAALNASAEAGYYIDPFGGGGGGGAGIPWF